MNTQNVLISMNIGALCRLKFKCKYFFELFLKRCNLNRYIKYRGRNEKIITSICHVYISIIDC